MAGFDFGGAGLNLTGGDKPLQVQGVHVTQQYFDILGAPVIQGRTFTQAEDSPNGGRVTVLSYGLWKSRFGGNSQIVGSTIQMNGQPYLVVGVIGKSFVTDTPTDLWLALSVRYEHAGPGALLHGGGAAETGNHVWAGECAAEAGGGRIPAHLWAAGDGAAGWVWRGVAAGGG